MNVRSFPGLKRAASSGRQKVDRSHFLMALLFLWLPWTVAGSCQADFLRADDFQQFRAGRHLKIVTDLPLDDSIRELGNVFDQAMTHWCEYFGVPSASVQTWSVTMYLMLDRDRFERAGLLPEDGVRFPHGWQSDQRIWIMEQPSEFYRRHLMLHEGTHWFMLQLHGRYHVPWLAEGLAEWFGTHRWQDGRLETRVVPNSRQEAPYWGRLALIQQQLRQAEAPSIEQIWRYDLTAHQRLEAYSWSWAMVVFLQSHPQTAGLIPALLEQPIKDVATTHRWMIEQLGQKVQRIRTDWSAFVTELDYGYCPQPGMLQLSAHVNPLREPKSFQFRADRGWQATGLTVQAGQKIIVRCSGEYTVANHPRPWQCRPDGVTLEYHRGYPLGRTMMAVVGPQPKSDNGITPFEPLSIGSERSLTLESEGEIFFRINEPNGSMQDNEGVFEVTLLPVAFQ